MTDDSVRELALLREAVIRWKIAGDALTAHSESTSGDDRAWYDRHRTLCLDLDGAEALLAALVEDGR